MVPQRNSDDVYGNRLLIPTISTFSDPIYDSPTRDILITMNRTVLNLLIWTISTNLHTMFNLPTRAFPDLKRSGAWRFTGAYRVSVPSRSIVSSKIQSINMDDDLRFRLRIAPASKGKFREDGCKPRWPPTKRRRHCFPLLVPNFDAHIN